MIVKLLTEHYLEFLRIIGGCRCSSESTFVKILNCWKSHAAVHYTFPILAMIHHYLSRCDLFLIGMKLVELGGGGVIMMSYLEACTICPDVILFYKMGLDKTEYSELEITTMPNDVPMMSLQIHCDL